MHTCNTQASISLSFIKLAIECKTLKHLPDTLTTFPNATSNTYHLGTETNWLYAQDIEKHAPCTTGTMMTPQQQVLTQN